MELQLVVVGVDQLFLPPNELVAFPQKGISLHNVKRKVIDQNKTYSFSIAANKCVIDGKR